MKPSIPPPPPPPSERVSGVFRHHFEVPRSDQDELEHVSNVAYVRWVQDVALAHSSHVGWPMARYRELGGVFVVRRHEIDYLRPTYAGETVELRTWIESWSAVTSRRRTQIVRPADDVEVARAVTTWALVRTDSGWPRRIPEELQRSFVDSLEGAGD
ncbi:MAG: acyl-CoA thioesterase [Deltaproteobacteria bacterium]|nr:acyl-CoA thioesterase [Deltaproteobacteria bacterium]MBW2533727.1 acyl-CoA thioesterase [Deltaproteobacteria bacterium]